MLPQVQTLGGGVPPKVCETLKCSAVGTATGAVSCHLSQEDSRYWQCVGYCDKRP